MCPESIVCISKKVTAVTKLLLTDHMPQLHEFSMLNFNLRIEAIDSVAVGSNVIDQPNKL
jgi:hypothetical protein